MLQLHGRHRLRDPHASLWRRVGRRLPPTRQLWAQRASTKPPLRSRLCCSRLIWPFGRSVGVPLLAWQHSSSCTSTETLHDAATRRQTFRTVGRCWLGADMGDWVQEGDIDVPLHGEPCARLWMLFMVCASGMGRRDRFNVWKLVTFCVSWGEPENFARPMAGLLAHRPSGIHGNLVTFSVGPSALCILARSRVKLNSAGPQPAPGRPCTNKCISKRRHSASTRAAVFRHPPAGRPRAWQQLGTAAPWGAGAEPEQRRRCWQGMAQARSAVRAE